VIVVVFKSSTYFIFGPSELPELHEQSCANPWCFTAQEIISLVSTTSQLVLTSRVTTK